MNELQAVASMMASLESAFVRRALELGRSRGGTEVVDGLEAGTKRGGTWTSFES
jgi:hypothetical protein